MLLNMVRRRKTMMKNNNFTLMEVLMASFVLAILSAGIFGSFLVARHLIKSSRLHQEAQMLAFDKAWQVYHQNYNQLVNYGIVTQAVPNNSILFSSGGTIRSAVLNQGNFCTVMVRVDWNYTTISGTQEIPNETVTIRRYRTQL